MIRIEEPIYFYILLLLPLIALVFYLYFKYAGALNKYFSIPEGIRLKYGRSLINNFIFYTAGLLLLILSMTNPQYGYRKEKVERQSADIYIALDISQSMLAEDLSPSRLERAKKIGEQLIQELKTERIGLILFAGEAYMQMPLTSDYRSAIVFLRNASPSQAGIQGTAIGDAINLAARRDEDDIQLNRRIVIVITDGEDHEGQAADLASKANDAGTAVFTVGVGTDQGGFIPVRINNADDYLRDPSGQPVRSKLNSIDLRAIAEKGGGLFFDHNAGRSMYRDIKEKVERMERRNYEKTLFTARESYFQWLLLPGILLMSLPFVLPLIRRGNRTINPR